MGDSLKDLLLAEAEAEAIVAQGEQQRDAIIQQAMNDARDMEKQFLDRVPEIRQSFNDRASQRAQQTIAEIKLRYDERNQRLRELAAEHETEALQQALELILKDRQTES